MSPQAADLLVSLLHRNPLKRLGSGPGGAEEIMDHFFFANYDWTKLQQRGPHMYKTDLPNFDETRLFSDLTEEEAN